MRTAGAAATPNPDPNPNPYPHPHPNPYQAHLALLCKNLSADSLDYRAASTLLVAQVYLFNFYSWDVDVSTRASSSAAAAPGRGGDPDHERVANDELFIPQPELLQIFAAHRDRLLRWLDSHTRHADEVMEAIERVVSYTGLRRRAPTDPPARGWRRIGRFGRFVPETELPAALAAQERTRALAERDGYRTWLWRCCNEAVDTEINIELGEFTIKSSRMMLAPLPMGDFGDYHDLFGPMDAARRPQCALVASSAERQQVRLLGQRHDLVAWTADPRPMELGYSASYPSGAPSWVREVAAPWLTRLLPGVTLRMPAHTAHANVALLAGTMAPPPAGKGEAPGSPTLKQVVVQREPPLLHVYNIISSGRVWYRTLVFTSDADRSLHAPAAPPTPPDAAGPPLPPSRGNAMAPSPPGPSLCILRNLNAELGEQMLVPTRFLLGLLPDALLESYTFWQSASAAGGVNARLIGFENAAARAAALTHTRLHVELPQLGTNAAPAPQMPTLPNPLGAAAPPPPPPAAVASIEAELRVTRVPLRDAPAGAHPDEATPTLAGPARLRLAHPHDPALQVVTATFLRCEAASQILLWCDAATDQLARVELPRLRLNFVVRPAAAAGEGEGEGEGARLCCEEEPGFWLARGARDAAVDELLLGLPMGLLLENAQATAPRASHLSRPSHPLHIPHTPHTQLTGGAARTSPRRRVAAALS